MSLSLDDPNLKRPLVLFLEWVSKTFLNDPLISKLYHPKYNNLHKLWMNQHFRRTRHHLENIKRKYRGEFTMMDFARDNWVRLLLLNFGEFLSLKTGNFQRDLGVFSKMFFRGAYIAFGVNSLLYFGTHGLAAQYATTNKPTSFFSYFSSFMLLSTILYPVQYWVYEKYYFLDRTKYISSNYKTKIRIKPNESPTEVNTQILRNMKMVKCLPAFLVASACFSSNVYLYNSSNQLLNALYYPGLVASYYFFRNATSLFSVLQQMTNF